MTQPALCSLWLSLIITGTAALCDLRSGLIPNRLVFAGTAAGFVLSMTSAAHSGGLSDVLRAALVALAGSVLAALVPLLLYRAQGIGGGDVKLLAAVGAMLGPSVGLEAELYAFSIALLYAPVRLIWEGTLLSSMQTIGRLVVTPLVPRQRRPQPIDAATLTSFRFGPAIFLGTLAAAGLRLASLV